MEKHESNDGKGKQNYQFSKQFLNIFWTLAENSPSSRIEGALKLFNLLTEKQNEQPEGKLCAEVEYALKRLIRGLASVRESARQGFASALTELLSRIDTIQVDEILKLIKKELVHNEEKKSKQYVKQYVVGQIFGYVCLIQSGKLRKADGSYSLLVIQQLQLLAKWKSYLYDICYPAIIEIMKGSSEEAFVEHIWPHVEEETKAGWENVSPYSFALLLTCHNTFPDIVKRKFFLKHYGNKDVLHVDNHKKIKDLLLQSRHTFALSTLFDQIIAVASDRSKLTELWDFLIKGGNDLKLFTFSLLERILPSCSEEEINYFFNDDLVKYLISQLAPKTSNSREHLLKFTERLPIILNSMKPNAQLCLLQRLLISPGHLKFDDITRTQTHKNMVKQLSVNGVELYLDWLKAVFITGISPTNEVDTGPESDSDDNSMRKDILNNDRRWAAARMMVVVKQPMIQKTERIVMSVVEFFFVNAFFDTTDVDADVLGAPATIVRPISKDLREGLGDMFRSLMKVISNAPPYQDDESHENPTHSSRQCGFTAQGELRVFLLVEYAQSLLSNTNLESRNPFSEETQEAWEEMMSAVAKIRKKLSSQKNLMAGQAFQLLFLHVGLQLFSEPDQSVDILKDLQGCYKRALSKRRSSIKASEEPEWTEVVVEILLTILSKPDIPLRMVIEIAFRMICPHLTEGALQLLIDVFDPQKSNIEVEDSDDDEEDDIKEQPEEVLGESPSKKQNKKMALKKENEHIAENVESSDEDDDEESEAEDENEAVDSEFLKKVKNVLGDAALPVEDGEDEDESDSDMSDDTMMKKDEALSEVFKQRRRKDSKTLKAQLVTFKLRVLELIDIFIKKQSTNPLLVHLVVPIFVVATSTSKQSEDRLAEKATVLFKNHLCKVRKYSHNIADHQEFIHQSIEEMLQLAKKAHSTEAVSLVSSGCSFLMKILKGNDELHDPSPVKTRHQRKGEAKSKEDEDANEDIERVGLLDVARVTKFYADALEDFMTNRSTCLQTNLFTDLVNRKEPIVWHLASNFANFINSAVLPYRKIQACVMLRSLYKMPYEGEIEDCKELCSVIETQLVQALDSVAEDPKSKRPSLVKEIFLTIQSHAKFVHSKSTDIKLNELSSRLYNLQNILNSEDSDSKIKLAEVKLALRKAQEAINNEDNDTSQKKLKHKKRKKGWKRKHKTSVSSA